MGYLWGTYGRRVSGKNLEKAQLFAPSQAVSFSIRVDSSGKIQAVLRCDKRFAAPVRRSRDKRFAVQTVDTSSESLLLSADFLLVSGLPLHG